MTFFTQLICDIGLFFFSLSFEGGDRISTSCCFSAMYKITEACHQITVHSCFSAHAFAHNTNTPLHFTTYLDLYNSKIENKSICGITIFISRATLIQYASGKLLWMLGKIFLRAQSDHELDDEVLLGLSKCEFRTASVTFTGLRFWFKSKANIFILYANHGKNNQKTPSSISVNVSLMFLQPQWCQK